ncbi:uncharacterized protein LOC127844402 isoform X1 [Dreissena polymorpha]|uniref:uncharacterized protein LOC127844402 isoform X1 n=1 Tax=Dreissena polymorpha TaxID=45954 RepID=UPI002264F5A1|nr:uncharacterized protein LOC127844402 isoform X1 [Dreissena polymorpha]
MSTRKRKASLKVLEEMERLKEMDEIKNAGCTVKGCDSSGHTNGISVRHRTVRNCPLQKRRDMLLEPPPKVSRIDQAPAKQSVEHEIWATKVKEEPKERENYQEMRDIEEDAFVEKLKEEHEFETENTPRESKQKRRGIVKQAQKRKKNLKDTADREAVEADTFAEEVKADIAKVEEESEDNSCEEKALSPEAIQMQIEQVIPIKTEIGESEDGIILQKISQIASSSVASDQAKSSSNTYVDVNNQPKSTTEPLYNFIMTGDDQKPYIIPGSAIIPKLLAKPQITEVVKDVPLPKNAESNESLGAKLGEIPSIFSVEKTIEVRQALEDESDDDDDEGEGADGEYMVLAEWTDGKLQELGSDDAKEDSSKGGSSKISNKVKCPHPDCKGEGHITGLYTHHRSWSGCPKKADLSTDEVARLENRTNQGCPTPGCSGQGHVRRKRSLHRSVSGCPIYAMGKLVGGGGSERGRGKRNKYHMVILPKQDDPSKAILAACTEKQLIKLAAKHMQEEINNKGASKQFRPLVLSKNFNSGPKNNQSFAATTINLVKELKRYNDSKTSKESQPVSGTSEASAASNAESPMMEADSPRVTRPVVRERPNILGKRKGYRPKPRSSSTDSNSSQSSQSSFSSVQSDNSKTDAASVISSLISQPAEFNSLEDQRLLDAIKKRTDKSEREPCFIQRQSGADSDDEDKVMSIPADAVLTIPTPAYFKNKAATQNTSADQDKNVISKVTESNSSDKTDTNTSVSSISVERYVVFKPTDNIPLKMSFPTPKPVFKVPIGAPKPVFKEYETIRVPLTRHTAPKQSLTQQVAYPQMKSILTQSSTHSTNVSLSVTESDSSAEAKHKSPRSNYARMISALEKSNHAILEQSKEIMWSKSIIEKAKGKPLQKMLKPELEERDELRSIAGQGMHVNAADDNSHSTSNLSKVSSNLQEDIKIYINNEEQSEESGNKAPVIKYVLHKLKNKLLKSNKDKCEEMEGDTEGMAGADDSSKNEDNDEDASDKKEGQEKNEVLNTGRSEGEKEVGQVVIRPTSANQHAHQRKLTVPTSASYSRPTNGSQQMDSVLSSTSQAKEERLNDEFVSMMAEDSEALTGCGQLNFEFQEDQSWQVFVKDEEEPCLTSESLITDCTEED